METEMLGTEAYRPNGTVFSVGNPYTYTPTVMGTGVVSTNGLVGVSSVGFSPVGGYNPVYPVPGVPSVFGAVGGMGYTQSTTYNPQLGNRNEERLLKGQVKDLQFLIEHEFDEEQFLKQFNDFKEKFKKTGTYKSMLSTEIQELLASGLNEKEAKAQAEENCSEQIFEILADSYAKYTGGNDFRDDIKAQFTFDKSYINFIRQLQGKEKLYK